MTRLPYRQPGVRRGLAAALIVLTLAAWGCTTDETPVASLPARNATPKPVSGGVNGSVSNGSGLTPTTVPTATTSLTPSPTPTAVPTQTPSDPPPRAIQVTVSAATDTINVSPLNPAASPLYPNTTKVSAQIMLSNGLAGSGVTWQSSNLSMATVNSSGLVKAGSTTAGTVTITGVSQDGLASGSVIIRVTDLGAASITVE